MNKVNIQVKKEIKLDGRSNNTGRPVNINSARQARLAKTKINQAYRKSFMDGRVFKFRHSCDTQYQYMDMFKPIYMYANRLGNPVHDADGQLHVTYVGRTKVKGYKTFLGGERRNVEFDLRRLEFENVSSSS